MNKKRVFGLILISISIISSISNITLTGNVIGYSAGSYFAFIAILSFILGAVLMLLGNKTLEKIVVYPDRRGKRTFFTVKGLRDILPNESPLLQVDTNPPVDEYHINLRDFESILKESGFSEEERKKYVEDYLPEIKNVISAGYKEYFKYKTRPKANSTEEQKKLRKQIAGDLIKARAAERVLTILDPSQKKRSEKIKELKYSLEGKNHIYKPIREGTAAYVHYSSENGVEGVEKNKGFSSDTQALYFPSLEKAREFVINTKRGYVESITGASSAEKALIFQTAELPKGISSLVGKKSKSMLRAYFKDLDTGTFYTFEKHNTPR